MIFVHVFYCKFTSPNKVQAHRKISIKSFEISKKRMSIHDLNEVSISRSIEDCSGNFSSDRSAGTMDVMVYNVE